MRYPDTHLGNLPKLVEVGDDCDVGGVTESVEGLHPLGTGGHRHQFPLVVQVVVACLQVRCLHSET